MDIQEEVSLKGKTTMRIGGEARYYAECATKKDAEAAATFAKEKSLPLIVLGGGSNAIFADGVVEALVMRITADEVSMGEMNDSRRTDGRTTVTVESGKNLAVLINELAEKSLDLSPLTGILGTMGGAVFGNAGQGPKGVWIDSFIESVMVFHDGIWKTMSKEDCAFRYRESAFKDISQSATDAQPIIWSATLSIPEADPSAIKGEVERLLQRRIETQPHIKTAGSCFKAVSQTPAWKLIDTAGLRGHREGDVSISEKHANFLINEGNALFEDAAAVVQKARESVSEPLEVEMRFYGPDGKLRDMA